ncbi:hypothetical protein C725_1213 [Pacificimonas flava]|uniref:Uncharacterized protein n=1 Tax=Pacificimonas flava TaxID=1234595 RepID=M2U5M0_9SPHN|nr:hypothetical protein C725_1213 [Pacificimonas flava]
MPEDGISTEIADKVVGIASLLEGRGAEVRMQRGKALNNKVDEITLP